MPKFGDSFSYNGLNSKDNFNLILGTFNFEDSYELGLSREIDVGEFNKYRNRQNFNGVKFSEPLRFNFSVMKDFCNSGDTQYFTRDEIRSINKWLLSNEVPSPIHFYDNEEFVDSLGTPYEKETYVDYFGFVTEVNNTSANGKIIGLEYSFQCIHPYGLSELKQHEITVNSTTATLIKTLVVDNDLANGVIYPFITITPNETGNIILKINNKGITFNARNQNKIYINCEIDCIYDDADIIDLDDITMNNSDDGNINFYALKDGVNPIYVTGNCKIKFEWREPRLLGEY